jgi:hypothetical protein
VREYIVWTLSDNRFHWFDLATGGQFSPDSSGVVRVRVFPGFWINSLALIEKDYGRMMATLEQGVATPEHAAFVERLRTAAG